METKQDYAVTQRIEDLGNYKEWGCLSIMRLRRTLTAFLLASAIGLSTISCFANQVNENATEYRLSKYDVLNVVIVGYSDVDPFSNSVQTVGSTEIKRSSNNFDDIMIGPDGYVNLPYAGAIKLSGMTVVEATEVLTHKLGEYIKIPSMSVMVKQYGPRKVYVMGEVAKPGMYSLSSDYMNVFAALSSAGSVTKRGRTTKIAVVRVEDGKVNVQNVDITKFIKKHDISQNITLKDGDMIYVPRSNKIDLQEDIMPLVTGIALVKTLDN